MRDDRRLPQRSLPSLSAVLLLSLLLLCQTGLGRADNTPRTGEILVVDQGGDAGPAIYAVSMEDETLREVAHPSEFENLWAVSWGARKRLYVADGDRILRLNPYGGPDAYPEIIEHPDLRYISDIISDGNGGYYILDQWADPLGHDYSGALFYLEPESGEITSVVSMPHFNALESMVLEEGGTLLLLDRTGRMTPDGPPSGALYRVDPDQRTVDPLVSLDITQDARSIAILDSATLLIADAHFNVPGMDPYSGAILKFSRSSFAILDTLAIADFARPVDLLVAPDGSLVVLDARAGTQDGDEHRGALFPMDPESGELLGQPFEDSIFSDLRAMELMGGPDIEDSFIQLEDLNSGAPRPGDLMRFRAQMVNSGSAATGEFTLDIVFEGPICVLATVTADEGVVSYDPQRNALRWTLELEPSQAAGLEVDTRIPDYAQDGSKMIVEASAASEQVEFYSVLSVRIGSSSEAGDMVFIDSGQNYPAPRVFRLIGGGHETETVFWSPDTLSNAADLTYGIDGMIYVLDASTGNCRILSVDPEAQSATVLYEGDSLVVPTAICLGHDGNLMVADPKPTIGPLNTPGVIYRFDLTTRQMTRFFADENLLDPIDICADVEGGYLITDYGKEAGQSYAGRLHEISGNGELIRRRIVLADPVSSVVDTNATIYIADARWDSSPRRGAIYRISRPTGPGGIVSVPIEITSESDTLLIEPYGVELLDDEQLLICDRESSPFSVGDHGLIFRLTRPGEAWELEIENLDDDLIDPQRLAIYRLPEIRILSLSWEDLSGGQLVIGDTLQVRAVIRNDSPAPALGVSAEFQYSPCLVFHQAEVERGELFDNSGFEALHWSGNLEYMNPLEITVWFYVEDRTANGEVAEVRLEIQGQEPALTEAVSDTVSAPLRGGENLVLDSSADPFQTGHNCGAIFILDVAAQKLTPYYSKATLVRPVDLSAVTGDRFLIVDQSADPLGLGEETGAIFELNLSADSISVMLADSILVSPKRLLRDPNGGWLLLDAGARPGEGRGAIYRVDLEDGTLELLSASPAFASLTDMALGSPGQLWLSDAIADPWGQGGNRGAIFLLDTATGAVIDTFATDEILDPMGILWAESHGLFLCDPSWMNEFNQTGVRLLDPGTGEITVMATSPYLRMPARMVMHGENAVLLIDYATEAPLPDAGRGAVFLLDLIGRTLTPLAVHPETSYLSAFSSVPPPEAQIVFFGAEEDSSGRWVSRGDTLHCEIRLGNSSDMPEQWASLSLELSDQLMLDPSSAVASGGELAACDDGLFWEGPLAGYDTVSIRYDVSIRSTPGLSPWAEQLASLETLDGDAAQETRLEYYVSSAVGPGELMLADAGANPRGFSSDYTGAIFRIEGGEMGPIVPILADSSLVTPAGIARIPRSQTEFLIVDSDASPGGSGTGGALFRASTETGLVEVVFHDSTLSRPIAVAALNDSACYMLDESADPLGLLPPGQALGAIYRIDLTTAEATVVFSDTILILPQDLVIDPLDGGLFVAARIIKSGEGMTSGGVLKIDPADGSYTIIHQGEPLVTPRALTLAGNNLLVVDPALDRDGQRVGGVVSMDREEGTVETIAYCENLLTGVTGMDIVLAEDGTALVVDPLALSGHAAPTGTVFRFDVGVASPGCNVYLSGEPLVDPRGADIHFETTPVALLTFELSETARGVEIRWRGPAQLSGAEFYIYRNMPGDPGAGYELLNPDAPVSGSGDLSYLDASVMRAGIYEYLLVATLPDGSHREFGPLWIRVNRGAVRFGLERVSPNPFPLVGAVDGVAIRFRVPHPESPVRLSLFDVTGRLVRSLVDGPVEPGTHVHLWNGLDANGAPVGSGVYFLRLQAGPRLQHRRIVLLR